jgi:hypothetical protein
VIDEQRKPRAMRVRTVAGADDAIMRAAGVGLKTPGICPDAT